MTDNALLFRRAVVSGFAFIYWGGVLIQARRVRKKIGRSPNLKPRGTKEKVLWLGWLLVISAWMGQGFVNGNTTGCSVCRLMVEALNPVGLAAGLGLTVAGYASTLWCYAAMGDAWRIGINSGEKNILVNRGPYRLVRHPIYLFQIVMLAGGVILLPTILSCAILLVHLLCVLIKAVDEERYLLSVHGEAYRAFMAKTGRLLPKFW